MAASYIPSDYRLVTYEDNGKVFGVDLEPYFYIDNTVTPNFTSNVSYSYIEVSNAYITHPSYTYNDFEVFGIYNNFIGIYDSEFDDGVTLYINSSWKSSFDFTQYFSFTSVSSSNPSVLIYTDANYVNNWLYVKDIAVADPYNITLTKPKLTANCAGKTMEKDLVVQLDDSFVVPTGTLEITENGTHDVSAYASANVNVASGSSEEELITWTINFTKNRYSGITIASLKTWIDNGFSHYDDNNELIEGLLLNAYTIGTYTFQGPRSITIGYFGYIPSGSTTRNSAGGDVYFYKNTTGYTEMIYVETICCVPDGSSNPILDITASDDNM